MPSEGYGYRHPQPALSRFLPVASSLRAAGAAVASGPEASSASALKRLSGRERHRALRIALVCWAACAALLWSAGPAGSAGPTEYQVKAVFLFNFSRFVDWPEQAFATPSTPLAICVLGDDPFGADLDEVVRGESSNGHPLKVQRVASVEDAAGCHILFISPSEQRRLEGILETLKGRSILTVADGEGFARRGVMIGLKTEANRVRLNINLKAAEAAGLTISSKLLRPAVIVESGTG